MRETVSPRGVVSGIFCGLLFWKSVLWTLGTSNTTRAEYSVVLIVVAAILLGPLALVAWSIVAGPRWRPRTLSWTRHIILWHGALGILLLLLGCGDHLDWTGARHTDQHPIGIAGFLAAVIDLVLLGLIPKPSSDQESLRLYRQAVLALGGGALLAVMIWPFAVTAVVATEAEILAQGHPYCIQITGDDAHGYRRATSLSDLNGLIMHPVQAGLNGEFYPTFSAVLIIQTPDTALHWRNWSYWRWWFMPIADETLKVLYARAPSCEPTTHFVRQLPLIPPS